MILTANTNNSGEMFMATTLVAFKQPKHEKRQTNKNTKRIITTTKYCRSREKCGRKKDAWMEAYHIFFTRCKIKK